MGTLGDAIKAAFEALKAPNYKPPEPETFELPWEPGPNEYAVTFLHRGSLTRTPKPETFDLETD